MLWWAFLIEQFDLGKLKVDIQNVKRVTIGKVLPEDENKMRPNENFRKYFPEVEQPEEKMVSCRSSCLKTGAYMIIDKAAKDLELDTKL